MKKIWFRGKRVDNGKWTYGYLVNEHYIGIAYHTLSSIHDNFTVDGEIEEVIPETVGQLTGLKDKSGEDIYEGDKIIWNYDSDKVTAIVGFIYGSFVAMFDNQEIPISEYLNQDIEIIGNIHKE